MEKLLRLGYSGARLPPPWAEGCNPVVPPGNEVVFEKLPKVVASVFAMLLRMCPAASQFERTC